MVHLRIITYFQILAILCYENLAQIQYCQILSQDQSNCIQCQSGFELIKSQQSQQTLSSDFQDENSTFICRAKCEDNFFKQMSSESQQCSSICNLSQFGNNELRTCEQIQQCPYSIELGNQFHKGQVDNLLLYKPKDVTLAKDIITSSSYDNRILIWDHLTGQLRAELKGHAFNILGIILNENSSPDGDTNTYLTSFSISGEVIQWNYEKAFIMSKSQVNQGHLTLKSEVNFEMKTIISYGYSGEFYVVNYVTQKSIKFVGHSNQVEQVIYLGNNYLLSFGKDKQLFFWDIQMYNQPIQLYTFNSEKIQILQTQFGQDTLHQLFSLCSISDQISKLVVLTSTIQLDNAKDSFQQGIQILDDNIDSLIDYLVDFNNMILITFTAKEVIIYKQQIKDNQINYKFFDKLDATQLGNRSAPILSANLFNSNFIIAFEGAQIGFFQLQLNQVGSQLNQVTGNSFVTLEKEKNSSQLNIVFLDSETVFIFNEQVVQINFKEMKINYIINNWVSPAIQHTDLVTDIRHIPKFKIFTTSSKDSLIFVYDYDSFEIINTLYHPDNIVNNNSLIKPLKVGITFDSSICAIYDDNSLICFDPLTSEIRYSFKNELEQFNYLKVDLKKNFIFASGLSSGYFFNLDQRKVESFKIKENQFFLVNFNPTVSLLFASTPEGYYMRFRYPDFVEQASKDYTSINPQKQIVAGSNVDDLVNTWIVHYDKGLVNIVYADLTPLKSVQYSQVPGVCGVFFSYPFMALCGTKSGGIVGWYLFVNQTFEKQLLNFPIDAGFFSFKYGLGFMLIDQQAYGSEILVGNLSTLLGEQSFFSSIKIYAIYLNEDKLRVFSQMITGDVYGYHFTPQPYSIIKWQENETQIIKEILIFQEDYKLIILSKKITIYDYLNSKIYKTQQSHDNYISGAIIDKKRFVIISFNKDTQKNLFLWSYYQDQVRELVGHTQGVNGAFIIDHTKGRLLSYSDDGFIIIWDYLTGIQINKLIPHQQTAVINMIQSLIAVNGKQIIVSIGMNQLVTLMDVQKGDILSQILLSNTNCKISLDIQYSRLFIYFKNSIQVYTLSTGLKITELLGFDGQIVNILFEDNYIIAHADLVIQSFNRKTLDLIYTGKSTQNIYQISILGDLVAMISDSINDVIKIWNYKTGVLLQDMVNYYYPIKINGILGDKEANIFLVRNINNQIFTFNPYVDKINKVQDFLIHTTFTPEPIQQLLIDKQSNLLFAFNSNSIMVWKYYAYLGIKGQQKKLPQIYYNNLAYDRTQGNQIFSFQKTLFNNIKLFFDYLKIKDTIYYGDLEQNLWKISNNQINYSYKLDLRALQCIVVGKTIIIRQRKQITSFNNNNQQISTLFTATDQLIHSQGEESFIFAATVNQDIIKIHIDQSNQSLKIVKQYDLNQSLKGSLLSRINHKIINADYKHLIISLISGNIYIFDYVNDIQIADLSNHSDSITKIIYDVSITKLISCSYDGSIITYKYNQDSIVVDKVLTLQGVIEEIEYDKKYNRIFMWINLVTKVFILDLTSLQIKMFILAPGDANIKIKVGQEGDLFAVYNLFQINIYKRDTLQFVSNVRYPSDLQDVDDLEFLTNNLILIISKTSIRTYLISSNSLSPITFTQIINSSIAQQTQALTSTLVSNHPMTGPNLVSYSFENNLINLKGINYKSSFNYTYNIIVMENSDSASLGSTICFSNIYNPNNYFTLKKSLEIQNQSFKNFKLESQIETIKYNMIYTTQSQVTPVVNIFFQMLSDSSISSQNQVVYQIQQQSSNNNQRVLINFAKAYDEYPLEVLELSNFQIYIPIQSKLKPTQFNPSTKKFILQDGLASFDKNIPIITQGYIFKDISQFVLEKIRIENITLDGTQLLSQARRVLQTAGLSSLILIDGADSVYIKDLTFSNAKMINQYVFKIQNVQNIVIDSVIIENAEFEQNQFLSIDNGEEDTQNIISIFKIINCKNLIIKNIKVSNINNLNLLNVLNLQGNLLSQISQVEVNSITNVRILFYTSSYVEQDYQFKANKDNLTIQDFKIKNTLSDKYSQISVTSYNVEIQNINSFNVTCKYCHGATLNIQVSSFELSYSEFIENHSQEGGAIDLSDCSRNCKINYSEFKLNKATNGGAISLINSDLIILNSIITQNSAYIGGGIRYKVRSPAQFLKNEWKNQNNTIQDNFASVFGRNIASYPSQIKIFIEDQSLDTKLSQNQCNSLFQQNSQFINFFYFKKALPFVQNYALSNFMSGDQLKLRINLIDEEGEIVKINTNLFEEYPQIIQDELNQYQIQCFTDNDAIQLNYETLIGLSKYDQITNSFIFDKLVMQAQPKSQNYFYIKISMIQIPQLIEPYTLYTPDNIVFIQVKFRACKVGEINIPSLNGQPEYCKKCVEGWYSLLDPDNQNNPISCQLCPSSAYKCQGNEIVLKNGYWRESNFTDEIIRCSNAPENCIGEMKENRNYCKEGYIGALCESCDIKGREWGRKFSKSSQNKYVCQQCEDRDDSITIQIVSIFVILFYLTYGIYSANKVQTKKIISYYLRLMNIISVGKSENEDNTSVYLKFLMHYLFISSIIKKTQFKLPFTVSFVQIQVSTPVDSMRAFPECYSQIFSLNVKPIYYRQIIAQLLPVCYLFGLLIIYWAIVASKKAKHSRTLQVSGLVFFFLFIQPDLLQSIISGSSCRQIGSKKYITDDISEECLTSNHLLFLFSFNLPFFLIWAIVFPLILFRSIFKVRQNLNSYFSRFKYGFIYSEYKLKIFYWEFVKMFLKLLISLVNNFFFEEEAIKSTIIISFILLYLASAVYTHPYISHEYNRIDRALHFNLILILQLNIINQLSQQDSFMSNFAVVLFYILHYSYLIFSIFKISNFVIRTKFLKFTQKIPFFQKYLPYLAKYLQVSFYDKMKTFKNWKLVYKKVLQAQKTNKLIKQFTHQPCQYVQSQENLILSGQREDQIGKIQSPQIQSMITSMQKIKQFSSVYSQKQNNQDDTYPQKNNDAGEMFFSELNIPIEYDDILTSTPYTINNNKENYNFQKKIVQIRNAKQQ